MDADRQQDLMNALEDALRARRAWAQAQRIEELAGVAYADARGALVNAEAAYSRADRHLDDVTEEVAAGSDDDLELSPADLYREHVGLPYEVNSGQA